MQFFFLLTALLNVTWLVAAAPPSSHHAEVSVRNISPHEQDHTYTLEKRKGGGGGKGGSSSGSGGGDSGGSGSSGGRTSGSGSGSGSGSRPASSYSFSPSSNAGGRTRDGSGTPQAYGNRYTGGAAVPYTAGGRSPSRGIAPYALPITALAFFPGIWLYTSVWAYPYPILYHWNQDGQNRTSNVTCLCQQYQVCGCDPSDNSTFLDQVMTNGSSTATGSGQPVNSSLVRTVEYANGSAATYINGSLANGTTAPGGTDPSNASQISAAVSLLARDYGGYWLMVAIVSAGIYMVA